MKTLEHNATTGKIIERELTEQEIAQIEIDTINSAARQAEAEAKAAEKAALLDRLGITADEAKLLLA
jgi:FMN-dependent NADH-azoreductase